MDYWNPAHIPTNCSNTLFRYRAPGAMSAGVNVKKLDDAVGTTPFTVRYFQRDQMRRDTGYYPDTPLSLTHALFQKPHMSGLRPSAAAPEKIVSPPPSPSPPARAPVMPVPRPWASRRRCPTRSLATMTWASQTCECAPRETRRMSKE